MYPQVFEIRFDNESKKYYSGQTVEGRVILILQKEKVVRGIDIRLIGKGNVYWDAGIKHNHVYSASEYYINKVFNLLVPEDGRQTVLQPGTYEYYFSLLLPPQLPSTLDCTHGFIRYYLEAAILRPWKDEQTFQIMFTVTSITDLNASPQAAEPASFQKEKHVGFAMCQSGPINLTFMIGKTGFVPGEYVQFGVEIRNNSSTRINAVQIALKRLVNCHALGETKSSHDKILQLNGPSAETAGYLLWQSNFEIPPLPPTKLVGCQIINIQYYVETKLALEKWADLKFNMPITIGTIPFRKTDALQIQPPPTLAELSSMAVPEVGVCAPVPAEAAISPMLGPEFNYDEPWCIDGFRSSRMICNGNNRIPSLPALDFSLFQRKPERHTHFKSHDDCECESLIQYPSYLVTSPMSLEKIRPPRPHSNPGHIWGRSSYWEDEDE